jgi:hypothetical protein
MKRLIPVMLLVAIALLAGRTDAGQLCVYKIFSCSKYPPPPKQHFKATKTDCFGAKFMKCVLCKDDCHGICIGQCLGKLGHCHDCCDKGCSDCCESCGDSCQEPCDSGCSDSCNSCNSFQK